MHTNRISPARKILLWLGAALLLVLLSGCDNLTLTNLTPPALPDNPSQKYIFTLRVTQRSNTIPVGSIAPTIIIDGQSHPMKKSPLGQNIYELDYQLPPGRDEVAYYYLVNYLVETPDGRVPAEAYTEVVHSKIMRRYVLSLETNRGPVGARISLLGRGFTAQDAVNFGDAPARTVFESPNAISFYVPALEPNRNYRVKLSSPAGNSDVGEFRIDPGVITVSPTSLSLRAGENQTLTFSVPNMAPAGGLLLDITTDAPESIIMPEVIVPQGQMTTTVTVTGGRAGSGNLFLKGYGAGEVTIPVSVTGK
ncbi:MAG: IPT/TIG domain-containing protein [Opitutaceae bacterium]